MTTTRPLASRRSRLIACAAVTLALGGCSKVTPKAEGPRIELTADSRASIDRALARYDDIRSKLANDQTAAVSEDAQRLEQAAKDATNGSPPSLRPTLEFLSTAAAGLQNADRADPEAVRKAFGDVSRATISLLGADARLSKGRIIYECAMTEGYGKWIQTTEKVSNPYMGSRMLECGAQVAWDANP